MIKFINLSKNFSKMQAKILKTPNDIYNLFEDSKIEYKKYEHKPAFTIEDLKNDPGKLDKSPFIKNLIFKDKKKNYYFIVAHENTTLGKQFWKKLGTNKKKVRFASEEFLTQTLHTIKGGVNIFCLFNDHDKKVKKLVFDS